MKNLHISPNVTNIKNTELNKCVANIDTENLDVSVLIQDDVIIIDTDFVQEDCESLKDAIRMTFGVYTNVNAVYPVNKTGLKTASDEVGSHRFCTQSRNLSELLHHILYKTDLFNGFFGDGGEALYSFEGVSEYFRFMCYSNGGMHFPHYDSDFEYQGTNLVTKMSVVVYFSDNNSGELAFVEDEPFNQEVKNDWHRQADDDEITMRIKPKFGRIVIFPHDKCHTVLELKENTHRVVVRGDLVFEKIMKNEILNG